MTDALKQIVSDASIRTRANADRCLARFTHTPNSHSTNATPRAAVRHGRRSRLAGATVVYGLETAFESEFSRRPPVRASRCLPNTTRCRASATRAATT